MNQEPPGPALALGEIRRFMGQSRIGTFSSNAKRILIRTGGDDWTDPSPRFAARYWDLESGRELHRLEHEKFVI